MTSEWYPPQHNGEPDFSPTNPPIIVTQLNTMVESGTYISFFNNKKLSYGRIIRSFAQQDTSVVSVGVNIYLTRHELGECLGNIDLLPSPYLNRFISVQEIFRTTSYVKINVSDINSIIFVFRSDVFRSNPYEGSSEFFCLRYEIDSQDTI